MLGLPTCESERFLPSPSPRPHLLVYLLEAVQISDWRCALPVQAEAPVGCSPSCSCSCLPPLRPSLEAS